MKKVREVLHTDGSRVLSLREKVWRLEIKPSDIREFLQRHQLILIVAALGLLSGGILVWQNFVARASLVRFYPQSCLGGWERTQNAAGEPSLSVHAGPDDFNDLNSAVLRDVSAQIFCSNFAGVVPEDTLATNITLKLSWLIKESPEEEPKVIYPVHKPEVFRGGGDGSLGENHRPSSVGPPESLPEIPTNETPAAAPAGDVGPPESPGQPETGPPPAPLLPPPAQEHVPENPGQTSWWDRLVRRALARESVEVVSEQLPFITLELEATSTVIDISAATSTATSTVEEVLVDSIRPVPEPSANPFLEVLYTLDGGNWHALGKIGLDNWKDASFNLPLESWDDIENLQISLQSLPTVGRQPTVYLDGMWLEVEYESAFQPFVSEVPAEKFQGALRVPVEGTLNAPGKSDKTGGIREVDGVEGRRVFRVDEEPILEIILPSEQELERILDDVTLELEKQKAELENEVLPGEKKQEAFNLPDLTTRFVPKSFAASARVRIIKAVVFDPHGREIEPLWNVGSDVPTFKLKAPFLVPGRYRLEVEFIASDGTGDFPGPVLSSSYEFLWGVLAINANRSFYLPTDRSYLQMAVLDEAGHTICDADLELEIKNPRSEILKFSTKNGTIVRSSTCGRDNVTDKPDYFTFHLLEDVGDYELTLTNLDNGYWITDTVTVRKSLPYEVERVGATRINPFKANYWMTLRVKANQNFDGEIIESLPAEFAVVQVETDGVGDWREESDGKTRKIIWQVRLRQGQEAELRYLYDAPDISPRVFLLGELEFLGGEVFFKETRQWQLASDAICTAQATGNWNTAGTWTGCGGVTPTISDDVMIPSPYTVTLDTSSTIASLSVASGGTLTEDSGSRTLTISGTATTTLFALAGTFNANTSTVVLNANATVTLTDGTFTFNKLSLTPQIGANRTYTFGSGALTINSDFTIDPGAQSLGTVTLTVNMGANITVAATATTTIDGNIGMATSKGSLNTTGSNYSLSTGHLNIMSPGILTANASTVTLTGTDGILFTRVGTFTQGTSEVVMNGDGNAVLTSGTITFNKLSLTPLLSTSYTYTFGSGALTINSDFKIDPGSTVIGTVTFTVNMGANITVAATATTTIDGNIGSATVLSELDTTGSDYSLTTGHLNIVAPGTLTANGSTISVTGDYNNDGTLTAGTSEFVFSGTGMQTLSGTLTGSSAFYNLTLSNSSGTAASDCEITNWVPGVDFAASASTTNNYVVTTASVKVGYNSASGYTFQNIDWNGQAGGTPLYFRNSVADSGTWLLYVPGTQTAVSYVNVSRSDASGDAAIDATNGTNTNCGNNTNWNFTSLTFTVSTNDFTSITPGTPIFATTTLKVDTNNSSGWNVTLSGDDTDNPAGNTTLDMDTDASVGIIDQTQWKPGVATTTAGNAVRISSFDNSGDVLAFRVMTASGTTAFISTSWWGTTDAYVDDSKTLWVGFASSTAADLKIGNSSVAASGGSAALNTALYYLDVASTQQTGDYSGTITFTAAVNP